MFQLSSLSLADLLAQSNRWDDLWRRSEVRRPTKLAVGIELWCRTFAPHSELTALVVYQDGRMVAGLPLVRDNGRWPLTLYRLPSNCTVAAGDFLLAADCDRPAATAALADQICNLSGGIAAWEGISIDSERWQLLLTALQQRGRQIHRSQGHAVGLIDIHHDWDNYTSCWSRNHRSAIKRSLKKLESSGDLQVVRMRDPSDEHLRETLDLCWDIEDKGWKGDGGTSIRRSPGLSHYYLQEALWMRDHGMLDLWLLKLDGQIIAFEYCHNSKGTCLSHKISFDPEFDRFSPGRVLRCLQLQHYHDDPTVHWLDTLGVLCDAKAKWVTQTYLSSRCYVAIGGGVSNTLLAGFKTARGWVKRWRGSDTRQPEIKLGAEKYLETVADRPAPGKVAPGNVVTGKVVTAAATIPLDGFSDATAWSANTTSQL